MRISPPLLLLMLVTFIFSPSIQEWITSGGAAWYRPYLLWVIAIIVVFWSVRRSERRQALNANKENSSDAL
jgi:cytochrome c-type biogenesis protein CcmH/NrfF